MGAPEAIHYVKGTVFISQDLLKPPIIANNLEGYCVCLRKAIVALLF